MRVLSSERPDCANPKWQPLAVLFVFAVSLGLNGCGGGVRDPYDRQQVSGSVTFDGQPVDPGAITFFPSQNGPVSAGSNIQGGKFTINKEQGLPPGEYRVSVSAPDFRGPNGTIPQDVMTSLGTGKELIPAKYNTKTSLTCDVKKSAENHFVFELRSK